MPLTFEQFSILRLIRSQGIGPQTFWWLMGQFQSAELILNNWQEIYFKIKRKVVLASEKEVDMEIETTQKEGAQFLFYSDDLYPLPLRGSSESPPVLTIKGNTALLQNNKVALVGARNASLHGCRLSYLMAKELGRCGWSIISGLARGIDAAAHQGSLETGTIAVLGNGIAKIYPEEHQKLYTLIAEKGLLISEFSFDTAPQAGLFPRRNKLIASLAQGIVVVEAAYQSGSLLTAQYAMESGRDIFAVPGSPLDPRCRGSNQLIKQGAILVESAQDILEVLDQGIWIQNKQAHKGKNMTSPEPAPCSDISTSVLEFLSSVPLAVDDIAEKTGIPMAELSALLTDLELEEKITKHPGNKVSLVLQG